MKFIIINERQHKLLREGFPISFRRRITYNYLKNMLDYDVLGYLNPCDYNRGDFVAEACDFLCENVYMIYNDESRNDQLSPKNKDELYQYIVDTFGKHLVAHYNNKCK